MLCKFPQPIDGYRDRDRFRPCGQCHECRVNRRRELKHRMILEAREHPCSSFLTLTIDDDHLPSDLSVDPDHHNFFIDALQTAFKRKHGRKLRYFMCAEYGETTERPHYHYALFGYPPCPYRDARWAGRRFVPCRCEGCQFIGRRWDFGHIFNGDLTPESSQYVAGYVTKKMTSNNSEFQREWLKGRHPEFSRSSRRPGIGALAVDRIVSQLTSFGITDEVDFPRVLLHGSEALPLGRYMSDKLKQKMGIVYDPAQRRRQLSASMPLMLARHPDFASSDLSRSQVLGDTSVSVALQLLNSQRCLNLESRSRLFRKERLL